MQKIMPCLWFNDKAEEAVNFYASIFKNTKITTIARYGEAAANVAGMPQGSVMTVTFELAGQPFMALNGGPMFKFTAAVSFIVNCQTQEEVDYFWEKLSDGGEKGPCGWLKDKFGLSWQIVPTVIEKLMHSGDAERSNRVMKELLTMDKLDIEKLKQAAEEE